MPPPIGLVPGLLLQEQTGSMAAPTAFAWDFDGTLVDKREKNFNVVGPLLTESAGRA